MLVSYSLKTMKNLETVIDFHRDHTYARPIAVSFNLMGSGVFSLKDGKHLIEVNIEPGDIIRFNCKQPHKFEKNPGCRVGLFGWELNSPLYGASLAYQTFLDRIDFDIHMDGISKAQTETRGCIEKIGKINEETRKTIIDHLRQYKPTLKPDRSSYSSNRLIKWFGVEPDLRRRDGTVGRATVDRRLFKFVRRYDPRLNVLLLGVSH